MVQLISDGPIEKSLMNILYIRRALLACVASGAVMLTGCASYVSSNVTAFQDWKGSDSERSYVFERSPAQQNDLEQRAYERLVGNELSTYGFRLTNRAAAHYAVRLAYGQRETTGYAPQAVPLYAYGGWGGGWGRGWGYGPWWGPPPIVDMPYAAVESQLVIRINDLASGQEVYKVTSRNVGDDPSLPRVMPYLVRSALFDFPMPNGTTRDIRINVDKQGSGPAPLTGSNEVPVAATAVPATPAMGASGPVASPAK
jgi:hypothetical protein